MSNIIIITLFYCCCWCYLFLSIIYHSCKITVEVHLFYKCKSGSSNTICWKDFLSHDCLGTFVGIKLTTYCVGLFLDSISVLVLIPHCLVYYSFIVSHKIRSCESNYVFFFKIVLAMLGFLFFPYKYRNQLVNSAEILTGIILNQ